MKPEDILDGLGHVSDRMVLDAQNLKKSPRSGMKWGSLAACILCGLILLGVCAAKLWNRDDQQSQRPAEPSAAPVVSQTPQDSAEESIPVEDTESAGAEISDYQVAVTENAVYFIDPRVGLLSLDPESKAVTTILPNGECSLIRSEGQVYCLNQATRSLGRVEDNDVTPLALLEDVGPGWPILLGVSDGYVCWKEDWMLYVASLEDGAVRYSLPMQNGVDSFQTCGAYQGALYCVNNGGGAAKGTLFRIMLDSGEKEILWEPVTEAEPGLNLRMDGSMLDDTAWIEGDRLYLQGEWESAGDFESSYFCYDLSSGDLRELTARESGVTSIGARGTKLYVMRTDMTYDGNTAPHYEVFDDETGDTTVLIDEVEIKKLGTFYNWTPSDGGIYYGRVSDAEASGQDVCGLYYYDLEAKTSTRLYQGATQYSGLAIEPDWYWNPYGELIADNNYMFCTFDLTRSQDGIYFSEPASGIYRYDAESGEAQQVVSGIACRILDTEEGLYVTCSDTGEVYQIENGEARFLLTLEKESQIAVRPVGVKNGVLYWNWYATDLSTGETKEHPVFRARRSQPQIIRQGKAYCLGADGEIGYVDVTGGTEVYQSDWTLKRTERYGESNIRFYDDCILALQKEANGYGVYQVSYEDGSRKRIGRVEAECVRLLNLDGETLYLEQLEESSPGRVLSMDLGTGTVQTVMNADTNSSLQYASEIRVWNGVCYDCYRALGQDIGAVLHTYALSDGEEHTTAVGDTSEITEAPVETPNIAWPVEEPAE